MVRYAPSMSSELQWMRRVLDLAKTCTAEPRPDPPPRVAALLTKNGRLLGEAYRGQFNEGDHAEYCLLERVLNDADVSGATVYTTLEPCSRRGPGKIPCAQRLVDRRVGEVVIGLYDPNPKVYRQGWKILRDGGIRLRDFPSDLRSEISNDNRPFLLLYEQSTELRNTVEFDYTLNAGRFSLGPEAHRIVTRWSGRGHGSIHALDNSQHVAQALYAHTFEEIDDPGALDFSNYTVSAAEGEIVVFRNAHGDYALVQVLEVRSRRAGADLTRIRFKYEIRISPQRQ